MNRRRFLRTVSASLLAAPHVAEAQPVRKVPLIGVLAETAPPPAPNLGLAAFRQGLRDLGYVEGQNVRFEIRWYEGVSGRRAASSRSWSAFQST